MSRVLFLILIFLFGVLVWIYLQTARKDYSKIAVKFDSGLSSLLIENGVSDSNVISQSRTEKSSATHIWVEYFMELSPSAKTAGGADKLAGKIKELAGSSGLTYEEKRAGSLIRIDITYKNILLSKLILHSTAAAPAPSQAKGKKVAIVIDDVGYTKDISGFLGLGVPVTFAIMPREAHSKDVVKELKALNRPYILHLPMEPEKYPKVNPGAYALLKKMNPAQMRKMFEADLASVPGAVGINNHMGSAFTEDAAKMREFLTLVKEKNLFFLDSYTSVKTVGKKVADEVGVPALRNSIFLDLEDSPQAVRKQLDTLLKIVNKHGSAAAIGHIQHKNVIPALKEYIPKFQENGIEFVYLPDLMK